MRLHMEEIRSLQASVLALLALVLMILAACNGTSPPPSPQIISSVSPAMGSDSSLVTADVSIVFTIDMDPASVESGFRLEDGQGNPVAGGVNYEAATRTVVFHPAEDLVSGLQYVAILSRSVRDATGGQPLAEDFAWVFSIAPGTVAVSTDGSGILGNAASTSPASDAEGRFVVFVSRASNLTVPSSSIEQVYRKDTVTGEIETVSADAGGQVAGDGPSGSPAVTGDGRFVVFQSSAGNLTAGSTSGTRQVYIKDMQTGQIGLISGSGPSVAGNNHSESPAISADGSHIVFQSRATNLDGDTGGLSNIFVAHAGGIERVSMSAAGGLPDGDSVAPDVSDDGRYVVFRSKATNLGGCTTGQGDIFVRDRQAQATICISVDPAGGDADAPSSDPVISGSGLFAVFASTATNLVALDTNGVADIFVRNFASASPATTRVNVTAQGVQANSDNRLPAVSGDGRYVAFLSLANNLVAGDTNGVEDVFVRDTQIAGAIARVSVSSDGAEANAASTRARISANGRYVSFASLASNLDPDDTANAASDIFRAYNGAFRGPNVR